MDIVKHVHVCVCVYRSCMMQADSEKLKQAWIRAMQNSIATAFRDRSDDSEVTITIIQLVPFKF